jgi:nucleotide-binding universal stress UspA family protein
MGSVSTSVVRHAHGSVLVVRGDPGEDGYLSGRVLLATDGSREAEAASRVASEISARAGSELHVMFALQTKEKPPYNHPMMGEGWTESLEQAKHEARGFVDERANRIEEEGVTVKDAHLAFGAPDEEIVKLGEELEAGLIVLGSRGLGGVRRALMGSVSDSVVRHAHGPVLVVRE